MNLAKSQMMQVPSVEAVTHSSSFFATCQRRSGRLENSYLLQTTFCGGLEEDGEVRMDHAVFDKGRAQKQS